MSVSESRDKEKDVGKKKVTFVTDSGFSIAATYPNSNSQIEAPGVFPFTRGIYPLMYREHLWTMRQYAGFSTAEESNSRYHYLLKQGVTGLSIAFDLPTQIGYDSDHIMAEGEVGKVGVAIDSLKDMEILFNGIDVEKVTTSMTINSTAYILLALYIAIAKKQGANLKHISGTVQNDILKEYAARGTYIYPPKPSMKLITDIFEFCSQEIPRWNTISISGYHIREAGANAVQELAFTLSNGKAYVKAAIDKGLDINVFGKRLSFFFNAHNDFFEEIAKFRAARRMWAKIMKELGASNPKAQMLRFHTQTAGSTLTAQQPKNNISRVTIQALSAVLGGTQSLHTNSFDEALSLPSEEAASIALRTQQIIAHESGAINSVDPLAGSYFIESLTDQMEEAASKYLDYIDSLGGSVQAIEEGYIQEEISKSAYQYQRSIEKKEKVIVGVNRYEESRKMGTPTFRISADVQQKQIEKLNKLKAERDTNKVIAALNELENTVRIDQNVMPAVIKAVEEYATVGEISDTLRKIYGEYSQ